MMPPTRVEQHHLHQSLHPCVSLTDGSSLEKVMGSRDTHLNPSHTSVGVIKQTKQKPHQRMPWSQNLRTSYLHGKIATHPRLQLINGSLWFLHYISNDLVSRLFSMCKMRLGYHSLYSHPNPLIQTPIFRTDARRIYDQHVHSEGVTQSVHSMRLFSSELHRKKSRILACSEV